MRYLFLVLLLFGCSISKLGDSPAPAKNLSPQETSEASFNRADVNNDRVIDINESLEFFEGVKSQGHYSSGYAFLFIIGLVFVFVLSSCFFCRKK